MSFTDEMYEAMRQFYLHGIPYPEHLGLDIADMNGEKENDDIEHKNNVIDDENNDESDSDDEILEGKCERESHKSCDNEEMVNCFPNRPSSALVITNESPPIWFKPLEVFEVTFADMSLSKQHTAAAGLIPDQEGRGVALRFPRFKRRRPDKRPDQATSCFQIAELFSKQSKKFSFVHKEINEY